MSEFILGIDEAGRGPVLGPMVYSCAYTNKETDLSQFKVNDSKQLNEKERNSIFSQMKSQPKLIQNNLVIIGAHELSTKMLKREKYNLNLISHDAAEQLIRISNEQIQNMNGILKEVYVDTVGDPQKYQNKLQSYFPDIKIVVSKKADSIYPIVSAASIFAKVTRDKILSESNFTNVGSGYTSDAKTVEWLKSNKNNLFGYSNEIVRFSWSTVKKIIDDPISVEWSDDEDEELNISNQKINNRFYFFNDRNLKNINNI
eukprot:gene9942-2263_t